MTELEPGERIDYSGPARRLSNLVALEVAGSFEVERVYDDAGRRVAVLQDVRHGELYGAETPPDLHAYIVELGPDGRPAAASA